MHVPSCFGKPHGRSINTGLFSKPQVPISHLVKLVVANRRRLRLRWDTLSRSQTPSFPSPDSSNQEAERSWWGNASTRTARLQDETRVAIKMSYPETGWFLFRRYREWITWHFHTFLIIYLRNKRGSSVFDSLPPFILLKISFIHHR